MDNILNVKKNKIVLLIESNSVSNFHGIGFSYARAFSSIGCEVVTLDIRKLFNSYGIKESQIKIKDFIERGDFDFLIFQESVSFRFSPIFFDELRKIVYTIIHMGDDEHYHEKWGLYYGQCFDLILVTGYYCHQRFNLYNLNSIFLKGFFPRSENKISFNMLDRPINVTYVGSIFNKVSRKSYIDAVESCVESYGIDSKNGTVSDDELYNIFSKSKISINFADISKWTYLDGDISIHRRILSTKGRCQLIALNGAMILTEWSPDINQLFVEGEECVTFKSKDELIHMINYFLSHDDERIKIAKAGYKRALDCYEERVGAKNLLELIYKNKTNKSLGDHVYLDGVFYRCFNSYRIAAAIYFIYRMKIVISLNEIANITKLTTLSSSVFVHAMKYFFFDNINKKYKKVLFFIYSLVK
jgi:hypothetical protein